MGAWFIQLYCIHIIKGGYMYGYEELITKRKTPADQLQNAYRQDMEIRFFFNHLLFEVVAFRDTFK